MHIVPFTLLSFVPGIVFLGFMQGASRCRQ
jgi:hypothetical protein